MPEGERPEPFLVIRSAKETQEEGTTTTARATSTTTSCDIPIYFQEDWNTGIGGGLWSTGLAFSKYLTTRHAASNLQQIAAAKQDGLSVLELGSGNGLLSVCILGLAHHLEQLNNEANNKNTATQPMITDLAITDLADHVPLMQKTVDANAHIYGPDGSTSNYSKTRVHVFEHRWGEFLPSGDKAKDATSSSIFEEQVQQGNYKFDLILGSDVAYYEELYDILMTSLLQYSHANTVILIGVTMADTKPKFFHKLRAAGFEYRKFSDHLLEPDFRGRTFGIFAIKKRK